MAKRKKISTTSEEVRSQRRLSCFLGCLSIILLFFIILAIIGYLLLRPVEQPPFSAFVTENSRALFVLNLDLDSSPLRSLAWKLLRSYYARENIQLRYQEFESLRRAIKFFVYPKIYIFLLDTGRPSALSFASIVNFRRAPILFRYIILKAIKDAHSPIFARTKTIPEMEKAFIKNSWIVADDYSALTAIAEQREKEKVSPPESIRDFFPALSKESEPGEILLGCVDNRENWLGRVITTLPPLESQPAEGSFLREFFSLNEWRQLHWRNIKQVFLRLNLLGAEKFLLQFEIYFTNSLAPEEMERRLKEKVLPVLRDLLTEEFVIIYSTTVRENILMLSLEFQPTATFMPAIFSKD